MTRIHVEPRVNPGMPLRTLATTIGAVAAGITNSALGRIAPTPVDLRVGDRAPEFTLPVSNGRIYKLSEFLGQVARLTELGIS